MTIIFNTRQIDSSTLVASVIDSFSTITTCITFENSCDCAASASLIFLPFFSSHLSVPLFPPFPLATSRESRGVFKLPKWVCVEPSSQLRLGAFWAGKKLLLMRTVALAFVLVHKTQVFQLSKLQKGDRFQRCSAPTELHNGCSSSRVPKE